MVNRVIGQHIHEIWPNVKDMKILGLGYSTPYLKKFQHSNNHIVAAITAAQVTAPRPKEGFGQTIMTDEAELPVEDLSIDRIILIHGIEYSESIWPMMREIWRVLSNNGRLIIIVPNRRGVWAQFERTPFGHGRPYSQNQLTRLLQDTLFTPIKTRTVLYMPPANSHLLIHSSPLWEKFGRYCLDGLGLKIGGVISIEAEKQIYAITPEKSVSRRRSYVTIPNQ
jgi:SAM-dependent methyltransferase